jgi:hypothetical protein
MRSVHSADGISCCATVDTASSSCSGYPECKWVKQNYIGVKCPECKDRGPGREARAQGQHVLWLRKLSELQVHFGAQAIFRSLRVVQRPEDVSNPTEEPNGQEADDC